MQTPHFRIQSSGEKKYKDSQKIKQLVKKTVRKRNEWTHYCYYCCNKNVDQYIFKKYIYIKSVQTNIDIKPLWVFDKHDREELKPDWLDIIYMYIGSYARQFLLSFRKILLRLLHLISRRKIPRVSAHSCVPYK